MAITRLFEVTRQRSGCPNGKRGLRNRIEGSAVMHGAFHAQNPRIFRLQTDMSEVGKVEALVAHGADNNLQIGCCVEGAQHGCWPDLSDPAAIHFPLVAHSPVGQSLNPVAAHHGRLPGQA